jgi:hypothetical protein
MKVYHGSYVAIETPDVIHSRGSLDFGRGFYLTSYQRQAERWAKRKASRKKSAPIVSVYEMTEILTDYRVLRFQNDLEWVEFVCSARRGAKEYENHDIIIGGVANDDVYEAVGMYFRGLWDIERTLGELKYYEINDQICIVNQRLIDELVTFLSAYEVK